MAIGLFQIAAWNRPEPQDAWDYGMPRSSWCCTETRKCAKDDLFEGRSRRKIADYGRAFAPPMGTISTR